MVEWVYMMKLSLALVVAVVGLGALVAPAQAANGKFIIKVVNEQGANTAPVVSALQGMLSIDPWSNYISQIQIIPYNPGGPLGCTTQNNLPNCSFNAIQATIPQPWDVLVVATNTPGDCGDSNSPAAFIPFFAVCKQASTMTIAHEMGHATPYANLTDEYLGDLGQTGPVLGNNCFFDQTTCQTATAGIAGVQCTLGCSSPTSYRTVQQGIMHNDLNPGSTYGAWDRFKLSLAIAGTINISPGGGGGGGGSGGGTIPFPCVKPGLDFGNFEQPLTGLFPSFEKNINAFITSSGNKPIIRYLNYIAALVTGGIVAISVIIIVIAGYRYIVGEDPKPAKTMMNAALLGIVLALGAYSLLAVISNQFVNPASDPTVTIPWQKPIPCAI